MGEEEGQEKGAERRDGKGRRDEGRKGDGQRVEGEVVDSILFLMLWMGVGTERGGLSSEAPRRGGTGLQELLSRTPWTLSSRDWEGLNFSG